MFRNVDFYFIGLSVILSLTVCSVSLAETPSNTTMWEPVNKSLTELLNSGWNLVNQSSTRVATPGSNGIDEQSFTFTLYKEGKYVLCIINSPRPENTRSRCRRLN
jgi:hypothetical protein